MMTKFSLSSLAIILFHLTTPTLTLTIPRAPAASTFKILVSAPTLPTLGATAYLPTYLTANSTLTINPILAAPCLLNATALYIGNLTAPVGAPQGALSAPLRTYAGGSTKKGVTTTWVVDGAGALLWKNDAFYAEGGDGLAHFWVRMDGSGALVAYFGGGMTADSVPATLIVVYD